MNLNYIAKSASVFCVGCITIFSLVLAGCSSAPERKESKIIRIVPATSSSEEPKPRQIQKTIPSSRVTQEEVEGELVQADNFDSVQPNETLTVETLSFKAQEDNISKQAEEKAEEIYDSKRTIRVGDHQIYNFLQQRWYLDLENHDYKAALVKLIENRKYAPETERQEHDLLSWNVLRNINAAGEAELQDALQELFKTDLDAWLAFKRAINDGRKEIAIKQWQLAYPDHYINDHLLDSIFDRYYRAKPINSVAVLLPLSGRYKALGEFIQEGMVNANFATTNGNINISFYDSADLERLQLNYNKAVASGVDFILGPLLKDAIKELDTQGFDRHIVLNWLDYPTSSFQFGLGLESEMQQLLQWLDTEGRERVLIFASEQLQDKAQKIKYQWESGNTLRHASVYNPKSIKNMRAFVEQVSGIQASKKRHRLVNRLLRIKSSARYRTRQDKDAIISLLDLKQQQVLQPQLKFSSVEWPLYGTSSLAGQLDNQTSYKDLYGLRVLTPNYLLDPTFDKNRFYVFGWDAWLLMQSVSVLETNNRHDFVNGLGGDLWLSPEGRIHRHLRKAVYRNTKLQLLEQTLSDDELEPLRLN